MANVKADVHILNSMTPMDKKALLKIYYHRCLTKDLLYKYCYYLEEPKEEYTSEHIQWLIESKLIEPVDYGADNPALFLIPKGIETLKFIYNLPIEEWDEETKKIRKVIKSSSDLKMFPKNIKHQMALNSFVLDFELKSKGKIAYNYFDEKFMKTYSVAQPDGLIELNNYSIFLEVDMGTERTPHLEQKWQNYREFLKSNNYYYKDKKIIVLFILNNVKNIKNRRNIVLSSLNKQILDKIDSFFDIYIDTPEALISLIFDKFIPDNIVFESYINNLKQILFDKHGFSYCNCNFLKSFIPNLEYCGYIRKLNESGKIMVQNGKAQEFLIDVYWNSPVSVLRKIAYYYQTQCRMEKFVKRSMNYIVIVKDEKQISNDLSVIGVSDYSNVFFSTMERLKNMSFDDALFQ